MQTSQPPSLSPVSPPRTLLLPSTHLGWAPAGLRSPSQGGSGQGGGLSVLICTAERPHHAQEKVRDEDLSQWDVLVVMSGDGLLHEVSARCHPLARAGGKLGGDAETKPSWKPWGRPQPLLRALWGHWGLCAAPRDTNSPPLPPAGAEWADGAAGLGGGPADTAVHPARGLRECPGCLHQLLCGVSEVSVGWGRQPSMVHPCRAQGESERSPFQALNVPHFHSNEHRAELSAVAAPIEHPRGGTGVGQQPHAIPWVGKDLNGNHTHPSALVHRFPPRS